MPSSTKKVKMLLIAYIIGLVLFGLYQKMTNGNCTSTKRLEGKVAIVTGGTSGIGLEISKDLARRGAKVIIACPFEDEGMKANKEIIKTSRNKNVEFKLLDLASTDSIRDFAADVLNNEKRIDILINNAGVGIPMTKQSYNGTNYIMQVNYFGHFLLTILLLPLLKKTGTDSEPSRIVNTSSCLQRFGTLNHRRLDRTDLIYRIRCYCNSKYCLVLFGHELTKTLRGTNVVVNAVDPGAVGTPIWTTSFDVLGKFCCLILKLTFKTPLQGAQTTLHAALDDEAGTVSGQFFRNCKLSRAKKSAYDDVLSKQLWKDSIRIVKLENEEIQY